MCPGMGYNWKMWAEWVHVRLPFISPLFIPESSFSLLLLPSTLLSVPGVAACLVR